MRITRQAKEATRSELLEQAARLFREKGFEETTTRDIATAVGLASGTLFNYFPSKETLAMTMVAEALAGAEEDFEHRRTGDEELAEELFLFVASGLRRLQPLHAFAGPVLERSLSLFPRKTVCPEGDAARRRHIEVVLRIMHRQGFAVPPEHVSMTLYWSIYLGILAAWANDDSPRQTGTRALVDYSLRMFVQVVTGGEGSESASED